MPAENKKIKILGIETSCDDTAIALLEAKGGLKSPEFNLLKNELASQLEIHKEYGGIVPGLAKRAHSKNLTSVLLRVLDADKNNAQKDLDTKNNDVQIKNGQIESFLERYPEMLDEFKEKIATLEKPDIDLIAVTQGPGLEPALWVGVNFARALSVLWNIPIIGVDHMEGHIAANLLQCGNSKFEIRNSKLAKEIAFPAISLAVSGGHTQLILVKNWLDYELIGETLDDAAGEAFDKVARLLGLGFPGGPEIQKLAKNGNPQTFNFPRPMLKSNDFNFSFSGLKTALLYTIQNMEEKDVEEKKADIAASFQQAVVDTLVGKTTKAAKKYNAKTVMLGGGVAANENLKNDMKKNLDKMLPETKLISPSVKLATDNGAMIAAAGYLRYAHGEKSNWENMEAESGKIIDENF